MGRFIVNVIREAIDECGGDISKAFCPLQIVKAFACIIMHDGLVAGIDASNLFFVSEFNSRLFPMELI